MRVGAIATRQGLAFGSRLFQAVSTDAARRFFNLAAIAPFEAWPTLTSSTFSAVNAPAPAISRTPSRARRTTPEA